MNRTPQKPADWLLNAWLDPATFPALPPEEQEIILRLARRLDVLGALRARLEQAGVLHRLSGRIQDFLEGGWMIAKARERSVRWEINRIQRAFYGTGLPVILLKGAAYIMLDLPLARGRVMADVDILLPEADLPLAEQRLNRHGWFTALQDPYDQHYYRQWMHELPPMIHQQRQTELDIHHAILPRSARLHPDSARLLAAVQPIPGMTGIWTLAPMDMILHAMTQLFHDHHFLKGGLRELLDLDALLRHYGQTDPFWQQLIVRADELDLIRPLSYGVRFLHRFCQTPMPEFMLSSTHQDAPGWLARSIMNRLLPLALLPGHPDRLDKEPLQNLARWLLYVRSHWLRMPPHLLIGHLTRKWVKKWHFNVWNRRPV